MKFLHKKLKASALLMTMFIMAGMMIVAGSASYVVMLGIRAGSIQAQSTKAYFDAESGAERFLWELRKGENYVPNSDPDFEEVIFTNGSDDEELEGIYEVFHISYPERIWRSVGEFNATKRGVEIEI